MPENLWPEFPMGPRPRTIRSVLLEAGVGTAERTGKKLRFDVSTSQEDGLRHFFHTCFLTTNTGFRVPLFQVAEEGASYPLVSHAEGGNGRGTKVWRE